MPSSQSPDRAAPVAVAVALPVGDGEGLGDQVEGGHSDTGRARALLMRSAHPLVVAGARQTGMYANQPWRRLERTLRQTRAATAPWPSGRPDADRQIRRSALVAAAEGGSKQFKRVFLRA